MLPPLLRPIKLADVDLESGTEQMSDGTKRNLSPLEAASVRLVAGDYSPSDCYQ
jgi:hypothetical protein